MRTLTRFPKNVWTPLVTEERPHDAVTPGDRILESWGVVTVESKEDRPDGRVAYAYVGGTHPQPVVSYDRSNWPTVVTAGGYAPA